MKQYLVGVATGRFYASHPNPESLSSVSELSNDKDNELFLQGFSIGFSNEQNGHYRADF